MGNLNLICLLQPEQGPFDAETHIVDRLTQHNVEMVLGGKLADISFAMGMMACVPQGKIARVQGLDRESESTSRPQNADDAGKDGFERPSLEERLHRQDQVVGALGLLQKAYEVLLKQGIVNAFFAGLIHHLRRQVDAV